MSEPPVEPTNEDEIQGVLRGLQSLFQSIQRFAESGASKVRKGVFPQGTGLQGVYGITVKADLSKPGLIIEVGQVSDAVVPKIEQFDEADCLRLVAEMPGVGVEDVRVAVDGSMLTLTAERGIRRYRRHLSLPFSPTIAAVSHTCADGIVEILIRKDLSSAPTRIPVHG